MFTTMTMAGLPKRIIDLTSQPCPYVQEIEQAEIEMQGETIQ